MRPTDLDDISPLEPDDDLLARVRTRSRSFRRRRGTQRVASAATVVVVVALAVGVAVARGGTNKNQTTAPVTHASTTTTTAPLEITQADLVGPWRPVSIAGYHGPLTVPPLPGVPSLRFDGKGNWTGSDSCNGMNGTYRLGNAGSFGLVLHVATQGLCVDRPRLPFTAVRVELHGDRLTFFAAGGTQLAQYVRAIVSAKVELPSLTMGAGSSMTARVVVENNTGRVLHASGCIDYFQVTLANHEVHQDQGWLSCLQTFTFPPGTSTYPVTIRASYTSCGGSPLGTNKPCLPSGGTPPLPPGEYQATLLQSGNVVPAPAPLTVHVTDVCSSDPLYTPIPRLPATAGIASIPGLTRVGSGPGSLTALYGEGRLPNYGCYTPLAALSQSWLLSAAIEKYGSPSNVPSPFPTVVAARYPGPAKVDLEVIAFKDATQPLALLQDPEFATKRGWSIQPDEHIPNGRVFRVDDVGNGLREYMVLRAVGNRWIEVSVLGASLKVSQAEHIASSVGPGAAKGK